MNLILLFLTFSALTIIGLLNEENRTATLSRSKDEWTADMAGLFIQGVMIPAIPFLAVPLLYEFFPSFGGKIEIHAFLQFLLSFVLIDYFYYWNHRIFHKRHYWFIHRMHHSSRHLDIFATSRNSVITSFLFVYIWSEILAMFLLKDATPFMLGLGLTFALDLWRHSGIKQPALIHSLFGWALILPEQHVLHHSLVGRNKNFGANLSWWDKLHGTFSNTEVKNRELERKSNRSVWQDLFTPWKETR